MEHILPFYCKYRKLVYIPELLIVQGKVYVKKRNLWPLRQIFINGLCQQFYCDRKQSIY